MIALKIESADVKKFMNKLLAEAAFDDFEFREAVVSSFIRFELDGRRAREGSESGAPHSWREIRPYVFNIIKGSERPRLMKLVFSYPEERLAEISPVAKALFINILFENESVLITSGCQTNVFTLDKNAENAWDACVREFMISTQTPFSVPL